jgi:membrane-bound metal-dependent hydrolase YbcI (DUF457 family)
MDFFTHSVVGALLYLLFLGRVTFDYFFLATFFSILPDLDVFLTPLKRVIKSNYLEHRGGSHSYIVGIIVSALISLIYSSMRSRPFFIVWLIGSLFYGLHVSMDLLTTTKIPYLFPLSKKEHSFYIEKAGSFFTMINLLINFYTSFFIIYYIYRIISRAWLSSRLGPHQKYLPGVLPFYYVIYDYEFMDNEISLSLKRGSHFSQVKEIANLNIVLKPNEKVLFEKGLEVCRANYYYAKWTLFPNVIRNDGVFSVRFFFLETMMRKRTMYNQVNFGTLTQQILSIARDSGHIQP